MRMATAWRQSPLTDAEIGCNAANGQSLAEVPGTIQQNCSKLLESISPDAGISMWIGGEVHDVGVGDTVLYG